MKTIKVKLRHQLRRTGGQRRFDSAVVAAAALQQRQTDTRKDAAATDGKLSDKYDRVKLVLVPCDVGGASRSVARNFSRTPVDAR